MPYQSQSWKFIQIQKSFSEWNIFLLFRFSSCKEKPSLLHSSSHIIIIAMFAEAPIFQFARQKCCCEIKPSNPFFTSHFFNPAPEAHAAAVRSKRNTSYHFILYLPYLLEYNLEHNPLRILKQPYID